MEEEQKQPAYIHNGWHLNDEGHRAMAAQIPRELLERIAAEIALSEAVLPPLPDSYGWIEGDIHGEHPNGADGFTEDQMRAYATAAVLLDRKRSAANVQPKKRRMKKGERQVAAKLRRGNGITVAVMGDSVLG